jgi:hypothetical protein
MTTYITNISSGKLKDVLSKLKKEDTLIIFHSSAEKQVPIEMISLFAGAKGKVEFKETEDEIEIAFEIGRLSAESGGKSRMNVEIIGDSPLLSKINGIIGNKKKPASTAKKTVKPAVKAEGPVKPTPAASAAQKKVATPAKETVKEKAAEPAKPASKSSKAKKAAEVKDSPEFDKAYDSFMNLLSSIKTAKYDPSECALGVLSAVRLMNEDASITFEAALPASTTAANSNKFLTNVSKGNIKKIVAAAKEVVKYDS